MVLHLSILIQVWETSGQHTIQLYGLYLFDGLCFWCVPSPFLLCIFNDRHSISNIDHLLHVTFCTHQWIRFSDGNQNTHLSCCNMGGNMKTHDCATITKMRSWLQFTYQEHNYLKNNSHLINSASY